MTGSAALVMTLGSIPFVSDLVLSGFDVAAIERREPLSQALACFFAAYLAAVSSLSHLSLFILSEALTGVTARRTS